MTPNDTDYFDRTFTYHPPVADQAVRYVEIRAKAREFAELVFQLCPSSRERAHAFSKIEEAVMWANAAIARNENHGE